MRASIDVRRLARMGALVPLTVTAFYHLSNGGGEPIQVHADDDRVLLVYGPNHRDGQHRHSEQVIRLDRTPCALGGSRAWFICPKCGCGRRAAVLYLDTEFACRRCLGLVYASQREDGGQRALRRAQNIRKRLGGSANMNLPFPAKPKGMHWKTYLAQRAEADIANGHWLESAVRRFHRES